MIVRLIFSLLVCVTFSLVEACGSKNDASKNKSKTPIGGPKGGNKPEGPPSEPGKPGKTGETNKPGEPKPGETTEPEGPNRPPAKPNNPEGAKVSYWDIHFEEQLDDLKGQKGSRNFTAFGRNGGTNKLMFFGTEEDYGDLGIYNIETKNASFVPLTGGDGSPGKANLKMPPVKIGVFDFGGDKTKIDKIVPAGDLAVISVTGLGRTEGKVWSDNGGVVIFNGSNYVASWRNSASQMDDGKSGNYNNFNALVVTSDKKYAMLFPDHIDSYATNINLTSPTGKTLPGPYGPAADKGIKKIVTAAESNAANLYVATKGRIDKVEILADNLSGANINFSNESLMVSKDDLEVDIEKASDNTDITVLKMVDGKLLIGLKYTWVTNSGGVAIYDPTRNVTQKPPKELVRMSVTDIAPSTDNTSAFIPCEDSFILYLDGKFYPVKDLDQAKAMTVDKADEGTLAFSNADEITSGFENIVGGVWMSDTNTLYMASKGKAPSAFKIVKKERLKTE